jgi:hypothetical protein
LDLYPRPTIYSTTRFVVEFGKAYNFYFIKAGGGISITYIAISSHERGP